MNKPIAISAVIPARNEADTIARVVSAVLACPLVDEAVVVNNGSTDDTSRSAAQAGAKVIDEPVPGQGRALRTGYAAAKNDWVVKLDADLSAFSPTLIETLYGGVRPGVGLVKGLWHDKNDNMPMTRLMVRPAIAIMFPGLSHISAVNSGLFLFNRSLIAVGELTDGYAADLDVMLRIHTAGWNTVEVDIGRISHDTRNLQHYNDMAEILLRFMIDRHEQAAQNNLYIVTQKAEDIIACSVGLTAGKLKNGGRVTAFLHQEEGYGADLLLERLGSYPTFSIAPISAIDDFNVLPGRRKAAIITRYFSRLADADDPVAGAALRLQRKYNKTDKHAILLMMPVRGNTRVTAAFRPDVRVDIAGAAALKKALMDAISEVEVNEAAGEIMPGSGASQPHWRDRSRSESVESFQAFDHIDIAPPFVIL